ncbi:OLC1v1019315C1 [Oldenlandia corymbosa var. corymbosa]|uniref:OLC1v1019315C1 n=1 Tax=Oldenlandia corymbosa var. corymbosa TaxID=529605 RepID=A0AAV1EDM0_OLDCO|nr:OLC1v1019315C1 [Oldenlandia corymbosa var. corymbosa]
MILDTMASSSLHIPQTVASIPSCCILLPLFCIRPSSETVAPKVFEVDLPVNPNKSCWSISSCNGLVLITNNGDELFLCNPCTKQIKKLPDPGMEKKDYVANFGFGYDKLNDDFKVVGLFRRRSGMNGSFMYGEIKVFSLRNNFWRGIENLKNLAEEICNDYYFHYASGSLHWCVSDGPRWKIAGFDLANETMLNSTLQTV